MFEFFEGILISFIALNLLKAGIVGSDFSFIHWIQDGKRYTSWYWSRETWEEYLNKWK